MHRNLHKTDSPLSFRSQVYGEESICCDSETADSSRDKGRASNAILEDFLQPNGPGRDQSRPLEIVYNKPCQVRPDYEPPAKTTDNHFLPSGVL